MLNQYFFPVAPSDLMLQIVPGGDTLAGSSFTLTCTVTMQLRGELNIVFVWPNGTEIENGTVEDVTVSSVSPFSAVLTLSSLHSSHEGVYRCMATLSITEVEILINSSIETPYITVQSE